MLHLHKLHMSASPFPLAVQLDLSLHSWQFGACHQHSGTTLCIPDFQQQP